MVWLLLIAFLLIIAILLLQNLRITDYKYRQKPLLSNAEKSIFKVLKLALDEQYEIFTKVRIADVLQPDHRNKSTWHSAFNKISNKHFDFIVCDKKSLDVLFAVELDDKSHNSKKAIYRDSFVNKSCEKSNLAIIRIKAKKRYSINEIQTLFARR